MTEQFDFDTLTDRRGTAALKWELMTEAEKRDGIVPLSVADMEFKSAPCVQRALLEAASRGLYGYTALDDAYVDALKGWMQRRHHMSFAKEELSIVGGVVPGLALSVRAFTKPGEGVIVQPPVYPPFVSVVELNGRKLMNNPLIREADGSYHMNFEELERLAADPNTKLMLFCSPHNPVGRVWTEEELKTVWDICAKHGVALVTDEIHAELTHGKEHMPMKRINLSAFILNAPSKTFNVPGLQLSNAIIGDKEMKRQFDSELQKIDGGNMPYFGRAAAIAAYNEGDEWLTAALRYVEENYRLVKEFFAPRFGQSAVSPMEGTYLAWVDFRSLGLKAKELENFTRNECRLVLAEGTIFGSEGEGFERINLALPRQELIKALNRLDEGLRRHGIHA